MWFILYEELNHLSQHTNHTSILSAQSTGDLFNTGFTASKTTTPLNPSLKKEKYDNEMRVLTPTQIFSI